MKNLIWYPALFAAYPILFLFFSNRRAYPMSYIELLVPLLVAVPLSLVLSWLIGRWRRQADRGALVAALFGLVFFSYGRIADLQVISSAAEPAIFLSSIFLAGTLASLMFGRSPQRWTMPLTVIGVVLVIWQPAQYLLTKSAPAKLKSTTMTTGAVTAAARPDVYFVLLDGYARADTLKTMYNFNNQPFIDALRTRGFFVADANHSNYNETIQTLSSMLNLDYLSKVLPAGLEKSDDRQTYADLIKGSAVQKFLQADGYTSVAYATGYYYTELKNAKVFLSPNGTLSEFHSLLVSTTPIPAVLSLFHLETIQEQFRRRMDFIFDHLADPAANNVPTFTFAHVIAPHPPFVVMADGKPTTNPLLIRYHDGDLWATNDAQRQLYVQYYPQQLAYVNGRVLADVDTILKKSKTPPIIVLMSDHGPGSEWSINSLEKTNLPERFGNFISLYLPGTGQPQPTSDMTPVNIFRLILSRYFQQSYPVLPNHEFFVNYDTPYQFTEVTGKLK